MDDIKKKFKYSTEYTTDYLLEVKYLKEKGFRYSFVYTDSNTKLSVYKFKKSPELFETLKEFWIEIYSL